MKFFVVFSVLIASVLSEPYYVPPGFVTAEIHDEYLATLNQRVGDSQKVSSGIAAKKGEFPDLCLLSIGFFQKQQTCGCVIWGKRHVVTSARCVRDCSEGLAANITVTILSASGKDAVKTIEKVFLPDGTNGGAFISAAYAVDDGVPDYRTIKENNVAVISVSSDIVFDMAQNVRAAKPTADADFAAWQGTHKAADGWKFRACGVGVINNKGERAKGVSCTDVNIVGIQCPKLVPTDPDPADLPGGQICLSWPDRDNNVCVGDYGGPVYAYKLDLKGNIDPKTQEVVCILVASPNVRNNAQCLDGHAVVCQPLYGPAAAAGTQGWINAIITPPPPPPARF